MQRSLLFVFMLCLAGRLAGQGVEKQYDHYTTASGLSHQIVTGVAQDSAGYVWVATASGLNRFDGSRFIQFHSNHDSASLAAEALFGLSWLDRHRLAVYTAGLHIVDTRTGSTRNVFVPYHDPQYQYKFNMIQDVMGDENGDLYILSRSGFYHYDAGYRLVSRFDFYPEDQVAFTHFFFGRDIFVLDAQRFLVTTVDGMYIYDKKKRQLSKMTAADCPELAGFLQYPNVYYSFFQPAPGVFLVHQESTPLITYIDIPRKKKTVSRLSFTPIKTDIHYRSKLVRISDTHFYITNHTAGFYQVHVDPLTGSVHMFLDPSFRAYQCTGMMIDQDRHLWVATNKGLFRKNDVKARVELAEIPASLQEQFPNIWLDDIQVAGNDIIAAARGDGGLLVFDRKTLAFKQQLVPQQPVPNSAHFRALAAAGPGTLIAASARLIFTYDTRTRKMKPLVPPGWTVGDWANDLHRDRKGNIWIGARINYRYDPVNKTFREIQHHSRLLSVPSAIAEDTSGHIWMSGHGIARYNTKADSF
ncbi:MAG TPA: hypothetical protein VFZ78_01630, partial [Flavisolibacter sp.]